MFERTYCQVDGTKSAVKIPLVLVYVDSYERLCLRFRAMCLLFVSMMGTLFDGLACMTVGVHVGL